LQIGSTVPDFVAETTEGTTRFHHLVKLISLVTEVVTQMPNKVSFSGHTDSVPYKTTAIQIRN
jgi:flagellar motor protein MotB